MPLSICSSGHFKANTRTSSEAYGPPRSIASPIGRLLARLLLLVLAVSPLGGCAAGALSVVGLAATGVATGMEYSRENAASKSFVADENTVRCAARDSLDDLHMSVTGEYATEAGTRIDALTDESPVLVMVVRVTGRVTRVDVQVGEAYYDLDRATAQAVADHIGDTLARGPIPEPTMPRPADTDVGPAADEIPLAPGMEQESIQASLEPRDPDNALGTPHPAANDAGIPDQQGFQLYPE